MNGCIYRTKDNECELWEKDRNCTAFCHPNCENPHPSNADRIRAMTDEELERFLSGVHNNIGSGRAQISVWNNNDRPIRIWRIGWLDWLKQESTNES